MKETAVQVSNRKIQNGIRKQREAREKLMWEKLTSTARNEPPIDFTVHNATVNAISYSMGALSHRWDKRDPTLPAPELRGKTFDTVYIDELVSKADE